MIKEQLPDSWIVIPLSEIAAINPTIDKRNIDDETLVSFVPMPAVEAESGRIDISTCRHFKEVKKGYTGFLERDVIFAKITPCMENGKVAVIPKLKNDLGFGSTEFHVIRAPVEVSPEFLYYYVSSKWFRVEAEHNMTGAVGQRRVPTSFLETTPFPLPPTNEQKRIVAKIEELFSEIDNGISALKTAREQLKVYRQAVLKHAFEGKLTEKWREENADKLESPEQLLARIHQEREARYQQQLAEWKSAVATWEVNGKEGKKPGKPREVKLPPLPKINREDLPAIPADWQWVHPEHLVSTAPYSIGIGPFGSNLKVVDYREVGVPLIFVRNITRNNFVDDLKYVDFDKAEELYAHQVLPLDLVITKMGDPPGDCEIYPENSPAAVLTADCLKFRIFSEYVDRNFYKHCINSNLIKKQLGLITKGVAQKKISVDRFKTLVLPFPSISEQKAISLAIDEALENIDKTEKELSEQLVKAETLRQSILKKAFSGQLLPQDPSDEPASELLARIRAEKAAEKATQKALAKPKAAAKTGTKQSRKPKVAS